MREGITMRVALGITIVLFAFSLAYDVKDPAGFESTPLSTQPWSGSAAGNGADVLFVFLGYDDVNPDTVYACGDLYWNPEFEESGSMWTLNSLAGWWAEPSGNPYHWNGGLGSAMSSLGYSWHWFPGYTGRSGQVIPGSGTLAGYDCVFVLTFDAYRSASVLTPDTRSILDTYMTGGGHVVLISQDAIFSGVPESWLNTWFDSGTIQGDVSGGTNPFPGTGLFSSFAIGWSGTALMENFSSGAGGHGEGQWWADDLTGNGCIGNGSYVFCSASDINRNIFSTFEFEACSPSEVESLCELIMGWMELTSLERHSWGEIKSLYQP